MKSDVNGCSTTVRGAENWERFQLPDRRNRLQWFVQYEYRHTNGKLFTCIKSTLAECRCARDRQLQLGTI